MRIRTVESIETKASGRREFLRRISYGGFGCALVGLLNQPAVAGVGCDQSQELPVPGQLKPAFRDTFKTFDTQRWQIWEPGPGRASVEAHEGRARLSASIPAKQPGPGVMAIAGFASRGKILNPGLKGTNGVEITFVDFRHEGQYMNKWLDIYGRSSKTEDPELGQYISAWSITIANAVGQVGPVRSETYRGVQFHWDWMSNRGLHATLVRNILNDDFKKYPDWDPTKTPVDEIIKREFIAIPCLALRVRHWSAREARKMFCGRVGLFLADNANTVYWTYNGKVMEAHDIRGHFSSGKDTASFEAGAYVTIAGGASYQKNIWDFADLAIFQA